MTSSSLAFHLRLLRDNADGIEEQQVKKLRGRGQVFILGVFSP
jgi:hypothetical protein